MSASSEIGITPNSLKRHDKLFLIFSLRYMTLHFPNVELNCVKTGGRYIYIHIIEEKKKKLYILVLFANHFISVTRRRTLKHLKIIIPFCPPILSL